MSTAESAASMTLVEHLRELRLRTIHAMVAAIIGVAIGWGLHDIIFSWLIEPYNAAMALHHPELPQVVSFRGIEEPFVVYLKTAVAGGMLFSSPYILLQLWLFVGPGLHAHEKRMAMPFLFSTVVCFLGGTAFCRYLVLGPAVSVLISFGGVGTSPNIMMSEYFSFSTKLLLAFGLLFEMPVVITFLALLGLVSSAFLIRQWRYAIVVAFILGAVFTPPDPLSQFMLAGPLLALYGISVGIVMVIERARRSSAGAVDSDEGADAV